MFISLDANKKKSGVTFVSAVVLVAVLSLSVWSALVLSDIIVKSQTVHKTEDEMRMITLGLIEFYRDCDQFPLDSGVIATDFADLESLPDSSRFEGASALQSYRQSRWDGPYVKDYYDDNGYTADAWNKAYVYDYTAGATSCTVTSYGLNRASGGGDDITITVYATDIVEEKIRKTREELAYINAKAKELVSRYDNAGESLPVGFGIDNLYQTYGADTTGLVGHWKMDESSWPGAGDVTDSSGSGNDGTAVNIAADSRGKLGGAGNFDGSGDYITVGDDSSLDFTTGITIEAWIKTDAVSGQQGIVSKNVSSNSWSLYLRNGGDLSFFLMTDGDNEWTATAEGVITAGVWYHVVATYNESVKKIYVNAVEKASVLDSQLIDTNGLSLIIGYDSSLAAAQYFDGLIDEVRVWNRALDPASDDILNEYLRGIYLSDWAYRYDEWENEYVWDGTDDEFYSYGPDRASGGGDDITQD